MAYGVRVGVRVNNTDAIDRLTQCFPPGWKLSDQAVVDRLYSIVVGDGKSERKRVRRFHLVYRDVSRLARTPDLELALASLESDMHLFIAEMSPRRVFVHAGVVGWKGKAIVIPGRTFTGKTTLVAELVRAGATYYSDEYAVLDARGRVHPFPRPLQIRDGTGRQQKQAVEMIGGRAGKKPLPVSLVVSSRYRSGAMWRPRTLSLGRGIQEMLANTVSARRQPEMVLTTLKKSLAQARILKSVRGEARQMTDAVLRYLDQ